ncbi:MAG: DUF4326 domain-containing protein [Candidatus Lokiarchaeota archaeon]|nr:DUF4326 domain-containing protein [Candidatus Lokiarchaeota archaeon]
MTKTKVVHCKKEPYDIYIGRGRCPNTGIVSIWGNPFSIGVDGTRDEVCEKYKQWILEHPKYVARLYTLKGKVLGCWCKPKRCHGDILVELIESLLGS